MDEKKDNSKPLVPAFVKYIWVCIIFILLALNFISENVKIDQYTLGMLILAIFPWLLQAFESISLPGGIKIKLLNIKDKVDYHAKQLVVQQERINDLVKYSISASIFHHLCGITLLKEYKYCDDEGNRREFYFLRDNGYIKPRLGRPFIDFDNGINNQNIVESAEPTAIGIACVKLRKEEIPQNMLDDKSNLRIDPSLL